MILHQLLDAFLIVGYTVSVGLLHAAHVKRDLAMLAYNNERQESRRWMFSYRDKDRRVQGLL